MSTQFFNSMDALARNFSDMSKSVSKPERKTWLDRVMGETIRDLIKVSFLAAKDGDRQPWKSPSAEVQFGGKFAASYHVRPSGDEVTADKVRLTDTGQLRSSYKKESVDADHVTVAPEGDRNKKIAQAAEEKWHNRIAGWGEFREAIARIEIDKVWDHLARGVPISRIRKPTVRAI